MELQLLWAGVRFSAQNGNVEGLLSEAARTGLHLSEVTPQPGGFGARCAAWRYRKLAALARKRRVRLHIAQRTGLYFFLRPFLRRRGLWAGLLFLVPLLLWSQNLVWAVDSSSLSTGQQARAKQLLRETCSISPGSFITQEKLTAGEYALLQSGEFSWASLNFQDGRLVVEAAAAKPVPDIAAGKLDGVLAKTAGTVVRTNLTSGTMLVTPGQAVEAGQPLIGTARTERDGTPIFEPAAGAVFAQFDWEHVQTEPLIVSAKRLTGRQFSRRVVSFHGWSLPLPVWKQFSEETALAISRTVQPEWLGLCLPFSIAETTYYEQTEQEISYTEEQALALAKLHSLQALFAAYPDAEFVAQKEDISTENDVLHYRVIYTIIADICAD